MQKILFIGASGMLGRPVARELIRAGFELTLLGREPEKLQKLFPNIAVIRGDVYDPELLKAALHGQDIVYLNLSINPLSGKKDVQTEREGIKNVIYAARETGVRRLAYLSSLIKNYQGMNGFTWWAFDIKNAAVDSLRQSGIPYSIFYPSTFMETLDQQMLRGNRLLLTGKSEAPMWFISAKDYGMQVAWAFKRAGTDNQEYSIQGPEAFTFEQAAQIFISHCKKKISIVKIPLLPLKMLGTLNPKLHYTCRIIEALNKYPEKFESENTWADLGKPTTTLAHYAMSY